MLKIEWCRWPWRVATSQLNPITFGWNVGDQIWNPLVWKWVFFAWKAIWQGILITDKSKRIGWTLVNRCLMCKGGAFWWPWYASCVLWCVPFWCFSILLLLSIKKSLMCKGEEKSVEKSMIVWQCRAVWSRA